MRKNNCAAHAAVLGTFLRCSLPNDDVNPPMIWGSTTRVLYSKSFILCLYVKTVCANQVRELFIHFVQPAQHGIITLYLRQSSMLKWGFRCSSLRRFLNPYYVVVLKVNVDNSNHLNWDAFNKKTRCLFYRKKRKIQAERINCSCYDNSAFHSSAFFFTKYCTQQSSTSRSVLHESTLISGKRLMIELKTGIPLVNFVGSFFPYGKKRLV